jgi:hypothetical protein
MVKFLFFFVANTFQIQPFHKGLAMQADVALLFHARSVALLLIIISRGLKILIIISRGLKILIIISRSLKINYNFTWLEN